MRWNAALAAIEPADTIALADLARATGRLALTEAADTAPATATELGLCALHAREQAWRVGRGVRDAGEPRAAGDDEHAIAPTIVPAHQHAAGEKGGSKSGSARALARRLLDQIHLRAQPNAGRSPLSRPAAGRMRSIGYDALMELCEGQPEKLVGDKGYSADAIRDDLEERGIEPIIPPKSNRTEPIDARPTSDAI
jgi:hypothetical protein